MGDWTGTVPTILAGDIPTGDDWDTVLDIETALVTAWTTWVPTLTNLTLGDGTQTARYRRTGKTVDYYWQLVLGSTSAVSATPPPKFTLPAAPASHYSTGGTGAFPGAVHLLDAGVAHRQGIVQLDTGSTVQLAYWNSTPTLASITNAAPWSWGTGDMFTVFGTYEAA